MLREISQRGPLSVARIRAGNLRDQAQTADTGQFDRQIEWVDPECEPDDVDLKAFFDSGENSAIAL